MLTAQEAQKSTETIIFSTLFPSPYADTNSIPPKNSPLAHQHNIDPLASFYIIAYIFATIFTIINITIKRGTAMQGDQEDLI